jgi:hypothetical protein
MVGFQCACDHNEQVDFPGECTHQVYDVSLTQSVCGYVRKMSLIWVLLLFATFMLFHSVDEYSVAEEGSINLTYFWS